MVRAHARVCVWWLGSEVVRALDLPLNGREFDAWPPHYRSVGTGIGDHITPLLRQLHWLRVQERTDYKPTLLVYKCLQGVAPSYLADDLCRTADVEARHCLRSASSPSLIVRRTRLSTCGDRAFPVAASRVWNSLPHHVTSAQSLPVFLQSSEDSSLQSQLSLTIVVPAK